MVEKIIFITIVALLAGLAFFLMRGMILILACFTDKDESRNTYPNWIRLLKAKALYKKYEFVSVHKRQKSNLDYFIGYILKCVDTETNKTVFIPFTAPMHFLVIINHINDPAAFITENLEYIYRRSDKLLFVYNTKKQDPQYIPWGTNQIISLEEMVEMEL